MFFFFRGVGHQCLQQVPLGFDVNYGCRITLRLFPLRFPIMHRELGGIK